MCWERHTILKFESWVSMTLMDAITKQISYYIKRLQLIILVDISNKVISNEKFYTVAQYRIVLDHNRR